MCELKNQRVSSNKELKELRKDPYYIGYGRWLVFLEWFWRVEYIVFPLLVIFEMFERKSIYFNKFIERLGNGKPNNKGREEANETF